MEIDQVEDLVYYYLRKYNIEGWRFKLGKGKRTLGMCDYTRKTITISKFHIRYSSKNKIIDTVRHEVAHILAGPNTGHGERWKSYAVKLGAKPEKYQTTNIPHLYHVVCENCNKKVGAFHRKPRRDLKKLLHRPCGINGILRLVKIKDER